MNLLPTAEQQAIADSAAAFLMKEVAPIGGGDGLADDAVWRQSAELGWLGLGADDSLGGVGAGLAEEAVLHRELGRQLAPGPYVSTILATRVAEEAGEVALARSMIDGELRCGMAVGPLGVGVERGHLVLVLDDDGARVHELAAVADEISLDTSSTVASISLGACQAQIQGRSVLDRGRVLVAAQLLGIAEACRDMSASFAATRVQFGKPIGTFQAVKHRCSDMAVRCETARSMTFMAALLVDADRPDSSAYASSAFVLASSAATRNAAANIQNHGGIGFTMELGAHRFVTRAITLRRLLGDPARVHADIVGAGPTSFA